MAQQRPSYTYDELIQCAHGDLFGPGNAQLPMPPMLMLDRITSVAEDGGSHGKGHIHAEFDIKPDHWFFKCHFLGDPVMPGCLGLDALWQMLGFYLGWLGSQGRGRALSVGEVKLTGMVVPAVKMLEFGIDLKRVLKSRLILGIGDGWVKADGKPIYSVKDLRVGVFVDQPA